MPPLTCQPLAEHPRIPIFHIIGGIILNASLPGGLQFEHINDVNGVFRYKGVWHVFHQAEQNHWSHVVSADLAHWKRLPSPVHPDTDPKHWYDSRGSFDGSAAILPGRGPCLLVDDIGPLAPPPGAAPAVPPATDNNRAGAARRGPRVAATDNPGCQALSWPVNLSDPELTHWAKDPRNPIHIQNLPCGTRKGTHSRGAFPGSIWQNGNHYNYLSFGYRFTSVDPSLHEWTMVPEQMLSNASADENGGQWLLRSPQPLPGPAAAAAFARPTHMVSCTGTANRGGARWGAPPPAGRRWCLGFYDNATESWSDFGGSAAAESSDSDAGPDANFFAAGYASGGMGEPESGDRLLTLGWATQLGFDPLHMRQYYDKSGGLTVPRELNYDAAAGQVLSNPVRELAALRNATISRASKAVRLAPGVLHTVPGTGGGTATAADIEVEVTLPAQGGPAAFSVVVLANSGYVHVPGGGGDAASGVTIALAVSARRGDGSRSGTATISAAGAAPCTAASPFCENATRPENGAKATADFWVLAAEETLALRVLVDRVLVEAFVQRGRVAFTKSFVPQRWQDSAVHLLAGGGPLAPTLTATRVDVWGMGCGWVDADDE